MTIPDTLLRDIIDVSTPEGSDAPYVKAKYLMVGMTIDLGEYFVALKREIDDAFMAPDLINAAELEKIIEITADEWLDVTGVSSNSANNAITIDTDNPEVPSLRLPEDTPVMVLIGDDSSKLGYTAPQTFADYINEVRERKTYNTTTLHDFIYNAAGPGEWTFIHKVQSWENLRSWLIEHSAPEYVLTAAASMWSDYEDTL